MASPIRSNKDFLTGLIYLAIGAGTVLVARVSELKVGTPLRMGPAYFPLVLSYILIGIGIISLIRSFTQPGTPIGPFALKGLALVVIPTLVFGLLVRGAGLIVALPLLVVASAMASRDFRWGPTLALAAGLTVFCAVVFLKGLGVPIPIVGSWFGG